MIAVEVIGLACEIAGAQIEHQVSKTVLVEVGAAINLRSRVKFVENVVEKLKQTDSNGRVRWENMIIRGMAEGIRVYDRVRGGQGSEKEESEEDTAIRITPKPFDDEAQRKLERLEEIRKRAERFVPLDRLRSA